MPVILTDCVILIQQHVHALLIVYYVLALQKHMMLINVYCVSENVVLLSIILIN